MTKVISVPSWAEPATLLSPFYQSIPGVGEDVGEGLVLLSLSIFPAKILLSSIKFYKGAE